MWLKQSEWWVEWQQMGLEGGMGEGQLVQAIVSHDTQFALYLKGIWVRVLSPWSSQVLSLLTFSASHLSLPVTWAFPNDHSTIWSEGGADRQWVQTPWRLCAYSGLAVQTTLWISKGMQVKSVLASWAHGLTHSHAHRPPCPPFSSLLHPVQDRPTSLSL